MATVCETLGKAAIAAAESSETVFLIKYRGKESFVLAETQGEAIEAIAERLGIECGVCSSGSLLRAYKEATGPGKDLEVEPIPERVSKKKKPKEDDNQA